MCDSSIFKSIILLIKYFVPIIISMIGVLKLLCMNNKKKAIKKFIKYIFLSLILYLTFLIIQFIVFNRDECILSTMNNNELIGDENIDNNFLDVEESINVNDDTPKILEVDGITYVDGILIVNKTYSLREDYAPSNAIDYQYCNLCLTSETVSAFNEMQADASSLGLNIYISSGYRSYSYQSMLYNKYVNRDGKLLADTYSARPGHSEHQTGLAFDLNTIDDSFAFTPEGKWVEENCWRYGLILRYPKGKEDKTGYQYESWHLRYVGKELAYKLYNDGNWLTLEEYFDLTSVYSNE